jgi:hypothetical protein
MLPLIYFCRSIAINNNLYFTWLLLLRNLIIFPMTRFYNLTCVSALLSILLITGCTTGDGDPIDITAPEIEVRQPVVGDYLMAGGYIQFEATFLDDLELGSYSIDIHDNFDGHGHGRIAGINDDPSLIKWSSKNNYIIPEGYIMYNAQHDDDIEIPANAMAGPYHFIVQAVDQAGNATSYQDGSTVEMEILMTNDSQPVANITNLVDDELELEQGQPFMVEGDISDPTTGEYAGMHALEVVLGEAHEEEHHHHDHGRVFQDEHEALIDENFEESDLEAFMVEGAIILEQVFNYIDFTLSQEQFNELVAEDIDHLQLTLKVHDEQGNITISKTVVHVHMD